MPEDEQAGTAEKRFQAMEPDQQKNYLFALYGSRHPRPGRGGTKIVAPELSPGLNMIASVSRGKGCYWQGLMANFDAVSYRRLLVQKMQKESRLYQLPAVKRLQATADQHWSACMAGLGYSFATPLEAFETTARTIGKASRNPTITAQDVTALRTFEIDTAVASSKCGSAYEAALAPALVPAQRTYLASEGGNLKKLWALVKR
jgi:hypothetical protein